MTDRIYHDRCVNQRLVESLAIDGRFGQRWGISIDDALPELSSTRLTCNIAGTVDVVIIGFDEIGDGLRPLALLVRDHVAEERSRRNPGAGRSEFLYCCYHCDGLAVW